NYLSLYDNQIGDLGIKSLFNAMMLADINLKYQSERHLVLNENPIGDQGILAIAKFLENNGQLTKLYINTPINVDDTNLVVLIASINKNIYLKDINCLQSRQGWEKSALITAMKILRH